MTSIQIKGKGNNLNDSKAFWLAEAGMQKAVWYLMTPVASGGRGENWTTSGTTENLGSGSYTMTVARWDFALAANGAAASASSSNGANVPARAIDGNNATYWESGNQLLTNQSRFAEIIITFPYALSIHRARFLSPAAANRPRSYTWQVSSDGIVYTVVFTDNNNNLTDVTNSFTPIRTDVRYLKLRATRAGNNNTRLRIATLEVIGSKITSTGSVDVFEKKIEQAVVADEATLTASDEKDWAEIMP
jgi:hypothetical protein